MSVYLRYRGDGHPHIFAVLGYRGLQCEPDYITTIGTPLRALGSDTLQPLSQANTYFHLSRSHHHGSRLRARTKAVPLESPGAVIIVSLMPTVERAGIVRALNAK